MINWFGRLNDRWKDSATGRLVGAYVDDVYYWWWRRWIPVRALGRRMGVRFWRCPSIRPWNWDKPHRCPVCHAIHFTEEPLNWKRVYRCCRCKALFARWPRLALWVWALGLRSVSECVDHESAETDSEEAKS